LLALALVLGGGGSPSPVTELALELLAVLILLAWLTLPSCRDQWRRVPVPARLIAGIMIALPLLQLIPLPPAVWQALPGRELQREALALVDLDQTWRPLSLAPQRTLASLLSLLPPLLMLSMVATLDRSGRIRLIWVVLSVGVASLLLGALQLTGGEASPSHLYTDVRAVLTGFQANRNTTADFLLIAMLAVAVLACQLAERERAPASRILVLGMAGGGMALFALGTVLTASRTGIALMPVPLLAALWLLRGWLPLGRKAVLGAIATLPLAVLLAVLAVRSNPTLAAVAERFAYVRELRPELWRDALVVVRESFPAGVGMGNFVPALLTHERLEVVRPFMPNRAHNDYLEFLAEAGIAGIAAFWATSWLVLREGWRAARDPARSSGGLAVFAIGGLTVFALHSVVDYPFRSMSMACLGGVCAALLMTPRVATGSGEVE
jgi:exopolysaccharide production protein ExoQ